MNDSLVPVGPDSLVFTGDIRKAAKERMYIKFTVYYLYSTYWGRDGMQVVLRSKNIYGPDEENLLTNDTTKGINMAYQMRRYGYSRFETSHLTFCQADNVFLIGDVPGLAQPMTGEGIFPSVLSGILCATAIAYTNLHI